MFAQFDSDYSKNTTCIFVQEQMQQAHIPAHLLITKTRLTDRSVTITTPPSAFFTQDPPTHPLCLLKTRHLRFLLKTRPLTHQLSKSC